MTNPGHATRTSTATTTTEITSAEELESLLGTPTAAAANKTRSRLDPIDLAWIAHSPFCLVATSAADGTCDVSPKGDPPGFVHVVDEVTIAVPERPGNRRADSFHNVLSNPHAGLILLVPGRTDTLRVNGRARLLRDAPYFDDMVVRGHRPVLALEIAVEEVYYHCSKAFMRSKLWDPASHAPDTLLSRPRIAQALERPTESLADLERHYGPAYAEKLYRES